MNPRRTNDGRGTRAPAHQAPGKTKPAERSL